MPDALEELSNMMGSRPVRLRAATPADFDFRFAPRARSSDRGRQPSGARRRRHVRRRRELRRQLRIGAARSAGTPPSGGEDVVPIAGDSSTPGAPQPPPGSDGIYQAVDDVVSGIVDLDAPPSLYGPPPEVVGGLVAWVKSAPKWVIPALLAIVVVIIVAVFAFGGSSKKHGAVAGGVDAAGRCTTTASTPTATTRASDDDRARRDGSDHAGVHRGVQPRPRSPSCCSETGQRRRPADPRGTVTAAANDPGVQKVTLALTGPRVPASSTMSVAPGKSVTHTFVGTGCASWTVRVATVNGMVMHAAGNPNLGERRDPQVLTGGPGAKPRPAPRDDAVQVGEPVEVARSEAADAGDVVPARRGGQRRVLVERPHREDDAVVGVDAVGVVGARVADVALRRLVVELAREGASRW